MNIEKEINVEEAISEVNNLMLPPVDADLSQLSTAELSKLVGAVRALALTQQMKPMKARPVVEVPRTVPAERAHRTTRSRAATWCKLGPDGFTPNRAQPAMTIRTEYLTDCMTPVDRSWTFLDQFIKTDDIVESWTIRFPCTDLAVVTRDVTRAWQIYMTEDIKGIDKMLIGNTPLAVAVDGITAPRYSELWSQLAAVRGVPHPATKWRVENGEIVSK